MARLTVIHDDSYQHADAEYSQANNYRRGYIVSVFEDGHPLETFSKIKLPRFCIIDIPGVSKAAIEQYAQSFIRQIDYSIVAHDPVQDGYRVDVSTINATVSGKGVLTRAKVENYLTDWGAVVVNANTSRVRFDVLMFDAMTSPQLWNNAPVTFSEEDYNETTGVHTIRATYNNAPVPQQVMTEAERRVALVGGVVVSNDPGSIVFTMDRGVVFQAFKDEVKHLIEDRFLTRRYYFNAATMDAAVANGGQLTMTAGAAIAAINDLAAE